MKQELMEHKIRELEKRVDFYEKEIDYLLKTVTGLIFGCKAIAVELDVDEVFQDTTNNIIDLVEKTFDEIKNHSYRTRSEMPNIGENKA